MITLTPTNIKPYQLKSVASEGSDKVFENQKGFWFSYCKLSELKYTKLGYTSHCGKRITLWEFNVRKGNSYTNVINIANLKKALIPFFEKWESLAVLNYEALKGLAPATLEALKNDLLALNQIHTQ